MCGAENAEARLPMTSLRTQLRENWPDAARLLAAAMLAYALARALGLHEAHWAVLTALITARGHAGGTARAGLERLAATIAGAALATAAASARHAFAIDQAVVLFAALAPLCLLVAVRPNYRGAPVAALIVLSAGPAAGLGPLGTALLRTGEIAIGAVASVLVSAVVFPSRGKARPRAHAATILRFVSRWLRQLSGSDGPGEDRTEALREAIRKELRELTILAHTSGWRKLQDRDTARLLKIVSAVHADTGFLARALARKPLEGVAQSLREPLDSVLDALAAAFEQGADALGGSAPAPSREAVDAALKALAAKARETADRIEPRHAHALVYVVGALATDVGLLASIAGEAEAQQTPQSTALS
jgi:uncharacterized membrane protein YccC